MESKIHISDEVMNNIVFLAATSVDGVKSIVGNAKNLVELNDKTKILSASLSLVLNTSNNIEKVCTKVQERVKEALEGMIDADVKEVVVRVDNIVEG